MQSRRQKATFQGAKRRTFDASLAVQHAWRVSRSGEPRNRKSKQVAFRVAMGQRALLKRNVNSDAFEPLERRILVANRRHSEFAFT